MAPKKAAAKKAPPPAKKVTKAPPKPKFKPSVYELVVKDVLKDKKNSPTLARQIAIALVNQLSVVLGNTKPPFKGKTSDFLAQELSVIIKGTGTGDGIKIDPPPPDPEKAG